MVENGQWNPSVGDRGSAAPRAPRGERVDPPTKMRLGELAGGPQRTT
jgi:hypothetical protein